MNDRIEMNQREKHIKVRPLRGILQHTDCVCAKHRNLPNILSERLYSLANYYTFVLALYFVSPSV